MILPHSPSFLNKVKAKDTSQSGRWLCGQQDQRMLEDSLNQNSDKPLPPHEASWIVMIESGGKTCIGHIVGSPATTKVQIVLTTRDCVEGKMFSKSASNIKVYRKTENSKAAKILKVHSVKQHSYLKELSILKLTSPITMDNSWKPVCLYYFTRLYENCGMLSANLEAGKGVSNVTIQKAKSVENSFCKNEISDFDEELHLCVEVSKSKNSENIGEAFVCDHDGIWQLHGFRKSSQPGSNDNMLMGKYTCGTPSLRNLQTERSSAIETSVEAAPWMIPIYVHEKDEEPLLCSGILADGPYQSSGLKNIYTTSNCVTKQFYFFYRRTKTKEIKVSYQTGPSKFTNVTVSSIKRYEHAPDIVILKLKKAIPLTLFSRPACLSIEKYIFDQTLCKLVSVTSNGSLKVRATGFSRFTEGECKRHFRNFDDSQLCLKDYDSETEHNEKLLICEGRDELTGRYVFVGVESMRRGNYVSITHHKIINLILLLVLLILTKNAEEFSSIIILHN
ncbi:hypothetical protein T4A_866 [Trichinella pseudospiralis]|uniref:Peptidase S1 domain-containing protein n=1 Tax=Trichinella pseudospiralis TaxID=6337 RepID=A0A0V1ERK0_TRIPS|nr:hypothetical protein T4A_866 [Trichinella pseudospiralis]